MLELKRLTSSDRSNLSNIIGGNRYGAAFILEIWFCKNEIRNGINLGGSVGYQIYR